MKFLEKYEKRITNIELVRIIAMFLIIMSHYKGYSGFEVSDFNKSCQLLLLQVLA